MENRVKDCTAYALKRRCFNYENNLKHFAGNKGINTCVLDADPKLKAIYQRVIVVRTVSIRFLQNIS